MSKQLPENLDVFKGLTLNNLVTFCEFLKDEYCASWHHEVICRKLEEVLAKMLRGEKVRLIIQVPPRHGKSETATVLFPAWVLAKCPQIPIIVSSYAESLAEDFGMKTRDIMNDERYQALFKTRIREDSFAKRKWTTEEGGGYFAVGVGSGIVGRGFKIGIIDDPFKDHQEAESKLIRDRVWNWYTSSFYTRQEGNGAIIVIMQRWHLDDLVGRLVKKQKEDEAAGLEYYDNWDIISFPAIAEHDEKYRKEGEALWPAKYPLPILQNIKNIEGPYNWNALFQQHPIASENQEFLKNQFRYFTDQDIATKELIYTTTVDLAISKKETADYTVLVTVGKEPTSNKWYIVDITSGRLDPLQTIDAMFMVQRKYRTRFFIESVAYQKALKYFVEEEQRRRQVYFMVDELKNTKKRKEERIRGLIPLYRTGIIHHRPTYTQLEEELLTFPFGIHDDHADALAMQLEIIRPTEQMRPAKTYTYDDLYSPI